MLKRLLCMLRLHCWEKWVEIEINWPFRLQERKCEWCEKIQEKLI